MQSSYHFARTLIPMASERAGSGRIKHCFLSGGGQRRAMKFIIQLGPASECLHCVFRGLSEWAFSDSAPLSPYGDANCLSKDSDFLFAFPLNGLVSSTLHLSQDPEKDLWNWMRVFVIFKPNISGKGQTITEMSQKLIGTHEEAPRYSKTK